jgi:hypothetical protein
MANFNAFIMRKCYAFCGAMHKSLIINDTVMEGFEPSVRQKAWKNLASANLANRRAQALAPRVRQDVCAGGLRKHAENRGFTSAGQSGLKNNLRRSLGAS